MIAPMEMTKGLCMTSENFTHYSPIDWNLSIKLANNNKELAKELLEMFITDLPKASGEIRQALETKQSSQLLYQVHKLHGASCYCGVTQLKEILGKMESSLKEGLQEKFLAGLSEFDQEINNVLSAYKIIDFI